MEDVLLETISLDEIDEKQVLSFELKNLFN